MVPSRKILGWLSAAALLIPFSTQAAPITWQFSGAVTDIQNPGANLPGFVDVGSPYTLSVTFDPSLFVLAAFSSCNATVTTNCFGAYNSANPNAVRIGADFGQDCESQLDGYQACVSDLSFNTRASVFLFNDSVIPGLDPTPADRLSFVLYPDGFGLGQPRWNFTLAGPTSIFASATSGLPTTLSPDAGFAFQELRVCDAMGADANNVVSAFSPCAAGSQLVVGREATSVPEPGTLALMGLSLAGLGFSRRKRKTA